MNRALRVAISSALLLSTAQMPSTGSSQAAPKRPDQYILISFDGSYNSDMWKATREQGVANNARYTHFISGVDFLVGSDRGAVEGETKGIYAPPQPTGLCSKRNPNCKSDVGFGGTREMLVRRIQEMTASMKAGMEIGGHGNSHFDGSSWSKADWTIEFDFYHRFLYDVFKINNVAPGGNLPSVREWRILLAQQNYGFRAPYLGRGEGLWQTLGKTDWTILNTRTDHRYVYDASQVSSKLSQWPTKHAQGFWNFPLVVIPVPGRDKGILSMDYNFYVAQSRETHEPNESVRNQYEEEMYQAYINWFLRNYHGNRAPLNIGHHFSTWNNGAYWKALQRFTKAVCSQPEVKCVTYKEMVADLEAGLADNIEAFQENGFDQRGRPRLQIPRVTLASTPKAEGVVPGLVVNGRIGRAPSREFGWKVEGVPSASRDLDLVALASRGVTHVSLVKAQGGNEVTMTIDWETESNTARLRVIEQPEIMGCSEKAHVEHVDKSALVPGIDI